MKRILLATCLFLLLNQSFAQLRLPSIIGDNMVLQQKSNAHLWGWANPGEKVFITTSWNNKTDSVTTNRGAAWMMSLPTPEAGGPYNITIKAGSTITLKNILIGEVWVCSGQSNMEMNSNWGVPEINAAFATSKNDRIRFFTVAKATATSPQNDLTGNWSMCDSNTLKSFSAVGYFFGKRLNNELNVPIGLINDNWGGTSAEVWTPEEAVANNWQLQQAAQLIKPADWWPYKIGACYNAMIAPITNASVAGAIWYQGEGNTDNADTYEKIFTTMIDSWRTAFNKNLPFYYVQIAPFTYGSKPVGAMVREQQAKAASHPNVGMVITTDLVDTITDIHPKQKKAVGTRLANYALAATYGHYAGAYKSPTYKNIEVAKDKINVYFNDAANGLMLKGDTIKELFIAGADHQFLPATASIVGDHLVVSNKAISNPVAVRFGFSNAGIGNLFSKEGLPVVPFRTDDWQLQ